MTAAVTDREVSIRQRHGPEIREKSQTSLQWSSGFDEELAAVVAEATVNRGPVMEVSRSDRTKDLSYEDVSNLAAVMGHEVSANTRRNYTAQWRRFCAWASDRGVSSLPADPVQVAAYLAERAVKRGHRPATLQSAAAAIAFVHRGEGMANPCETTEVRDTLRSARRMTGAEQRQAQGITDDELGRIVETACRPRRWGDNKMEAVNAAERRGRVDIAMIRLMRDALLRVSEAAALVWEDIEQEEDGTGRLLIRRSKTDTDGEGTVAFLSVPTMSSLEAIRGEASGEDSVFALKPNGIARRIKEAARAAGLGEGYSGHSPRVGMARDLARAGTELTRLMTAGRWRSPRMPALYTRNETVARGAVAHYYGSRWRLHGRTGIDAAHGEGLRAAGDSRPGASETQANEEVVPNTASGIEKWLQASEESGKLFHASLSAGDNGSVTESRQGRIKALIHAVSRGAEALLNYLLAHCLYKLPRISDVIPGAHSPYP